MGRGKDLSPTAKVSILLDVAAATTSNTAPPHGTYTRVADKHGVTRQHVKTLWTKYGPNVHRALGVGPVGAPTSQWQR
jgi:hypothetical protein